MPNKKIVYVGFGFPHLVCGHGGYHQIKNYLNYDYYIDCQSWFVKNERNSQNAFDRKIRTFLNKLIGLNSFPFFLIKILLLGFLHKNLVFHFIHGENTYFPFIKKILCGRSKFVCTFHQPFSFFEKSPDQMIKLKSADHVILLNSSELDLFSKMTGHNNISFIPHGICSDFYVPDNRVCRTKLVLTVGNWLRDYYFADRVYKRLLEIDKTVEIVVVTLPQNINLITPNERLTVLSGISDCELLNLYRKAACLFLPLVRYTANNALLESASVGCPILIASDHQDNCYIPNEFLHHAPMNVDMVTNSILSMLVNIQSNNALSLYVQNHYSWEYVSSATKKLLLSV